jgi:hypothetical protein
MTPGDPASLLLPLITGFKFLAAERTHSLEGPDRLPDAWANFEALSTNCPLCSASSSGRWNEAMLVVG